MPGVSGRVAVGTTAHQRKNFDGFLCTCLLPRRQVRMGHVLPAASVTEFLVSPAGMQHQPRKSMPEQVSMVVAALDKPKPQAIEGMPGAVQVRHSKVVSL